MNVPRRLRALVWLPLLASLFAGCAPDAPPVRMELFWSEVESLLEPGMSAEERSLAIAGWVVRNSTNDHGRKSLDGTPFIGQCAHRAIVFEQLAERAGLNVSRIRLANFNGAGHTAVQVRYDGAWHYLDVTYAGYFRRQGQILSFEEIRSDPEAAIAGMQVLRGTQDTWRDGEPVDNRERMRANYRVESIREAVVVETFL